MTEIVPVRIDKETLDSLDLFVTLGFYKSRSEAIREMMKRGLEAREEVKELGRLVKIVESLDKAGDVDLSGLSYRGRDSDLYRHQCSRAGIG